MVKQAIFCADSKIAHVGDKVMVNYKHGTSVSGTITFIPEDLDYFLIDVDGVESSILWSHIDGIYKVIETVVAPAEEYEMVSHPDHYQIDGIYKDIETADAPAEEDKMVSHPDHYQTESGLETITVIEAFTKNLTGIEAVATGNVIKYVCRWKKKNGLQDLKKAKWYLEHLIKHVEKETK